MAVKSVSKWRRRSADRRLAGLDDDAPIGQPKTELVLTEAERTQLMRWARRAKTAQFLALRAKIVLACADGAMNKQVAVGERRFRAQPSADLHLLLGLRRD